MIKRRDFLIKSGLALGALSITPSLAFETKKSGIGIQLYTLRNSLPSDIKGILKQVSNAGFTEVETFGYSLEKGFFGTSLKDFKSILADNGLKANSNHFDFNSIIRNNSIDSVKPYIEAANYLESDYITIPYFDAGLYGKNADDFKKLASLFNEIGMFCKKNDLKLAYHNHDFEFTKVDSSTGYEILLNETEANVVDFEMDLYWVIRSGNDPLYFFKKYPGRFKMWHVKDMDKINPHENSEIGFGSINFKAIFKAAELSGMKHFYLEQESNYQPNPIASVKKSINYIKKELL